MWIDRPINTVLRNDAHGDSAIDVDRYIRSMYAYEASTHPGVALVAAGAFA